MVSSEYSWTATTEAVYVLSRWLMNKHRVRGILGYSGMDESVIVCSFNVRPRDLSFRHMSWLRRQLGPLGKLLEMMYNRSRTEKLENVIEGYIRSVCRRWWTDFSYEGVRDKLDGVGDKFDERLREEENGDGLRPLSL